MKTPRANAAVPLALAAIVFVGGLITVGVGPAGAQCLSQAECDALRAALQDFRSEVEARKAELRELRARIQALPRDSSERADLVLQARELRREAKADRRKARPIKRQLIRGCKRC